MEKPSLSMVGVGPGTVRADPRTSIGRQHVESESSLDSVVTAVHDFPTAPWFVEGFAEDGETRAQLLSGDAATGACTRRVTLPKGWCAPIGEFNVDVELFVLSGHLRQGGFELRQQTYSYLPAGGPTGPWVAEQDTVLLWMPDASPQYDREPYRALEQIAENAVYHTAL